jgi:glycerate 2-kinase
MRVLVAFDKFRDSLSAPAACAAAAEALRTSHPDWELDLCPLADGGDGFAETLTAAAGGTLHRVTVTGPRGEPVEATFGVVPFANLSPAARELLSLENPESKIENPTTVAVVEMAQASGLALLPADQRNPWQTSTRGTGELLRAAAATGADAILLGVGGSATHDVGLGALSVLGLQCHELDGKAVALPVPETWAAVAKITGRIEPPLPPLIVACDVTNPLMGTFGAANVFAPQKGLQPEDFTRLEYMTGRMAALLTTNAGKHPLLCETPGAGAAGGLAFGLLCAADARLTPGAALVAAWLGLDERLAAADIVLTGEGRFDASSLSGKAPVELARRAVAAGKRAHLFAGSIEGELTGVQLHAVTPFGQELGPALAGAAENLRRTVGCAFV